MKKVVAIISMLVLFVSINSCENDNEHCLFKMMGQTIVINKDSMLYIPTDYIVNRCEQRETEYKCIYYVDSSQCLSCVFKHLSEWNSILKDYSIEKKLVDFIFIFQMPSESIKKCKKLYKMSGFINPIYIDTLNCFIKDNAFIPEEDLYHTFLLDENNEIILVGNPAKNLNINKLFQETINRRLNDKRTFLTKIKQEI